MKDIYILKTVMVYMKKNKKKKKQQQQKKKNNNQILEVVPWKQMCHVTFLPIQVWNNG